MQLLSGRARARLKDTQAWLAENACGTSPCAGVLCLRAVVVLALAVITLSSAALAVTTPTKAYCWGELRRPHLVAATLPSLGMVGKAALNGAPRALAHRRFLSCQSLAGRSDRGQLGNGLVTDDSAVPLEVAGDHTFVQLAAGELHTCGLEQDGQVFCWVRFMPDSMRPRQGHQAACVAGGHGSHWQLAASLQAALCFVGALKLPAAHVGR